MLPLTVKKLSKNWEKEGENQEKLGRKGKNQEGSFTLPLLTDRAGYATALDSSEHLTQALSLLP